MSRYSLIKDGQAEILQVFPLVEGRVHLTTGETVYEDALVIRCVSDGTFDLTWNSGTTSGITCIAGDDFCIPAGATVKITAGEFHLA